MADQKRILVIDDEEDILELLDYNLIKEGYRVFLASDGTDGIRIIREKHPDLIILDLMLPGLDGLDVCRIVKNDKTLADIPIVMLTAKGEEEDVIAGLELGADDYITKPFSIHILLARLRAVLRRSKSNLGKQNNVPICVGKLMIDSQEYRARFDGEDLRLTPTEFGILKSLAEKEGKVLTRRQLLANVQGSSVFVTERTIDVHLTSLRKKLGEDGCIIETVRGIGYRLNYKNEER